MDIDRFLDHAARIGMAVLVILAAVALPGCSLTTPIGDDGTLSVTGSGIRDGAEAVGNIIRGTPPTIRLPRGWEGIIIAKSPGWTTEKVTMEMDKHVPTGGR